MSTKPTIANARWADLGTSSVTTPTSGLRDTGFQDGTPADADIVNELLKQLYLWALYLNDGALTGNHSITGTLGVTGPVTASGGIAVPTGQAVALSGTTTLTVGTGTTTLGGALGVTGTSTQAAITASGLITANAGITVSSGQTATMAGRLTSSGQAVLSGVISPSDNINGVIGDWNPTGLATANVVRVTVSTSGGAIGGVAAQPSGTMIRLINTSANAIVLKHENTGSSAANRFKLKGAVDLTVGVDGVVVLWYDVADSRWRVLSSI